MTLRDRELVIPEMLVIVASHDDALALSPLAAAHDDVRFCLVATGADPLLVDEVLDELATPAGRILLPEARDDDPAEGSTSPALELAGLLPRLDDTIAQSEAAAVVVRGGTAAALAAAQAAVWRGVPLIPLAAHVDSPAHAANRAMIAELAAWQRSETGGGTPFPAWLDLVVHQRVAGGAQHADPDAPRVVDMPGARTGRHLASGLSA